MILFDFLDLCYVAMRLLSKLDKFSLALAKQRLRPTKLSLDFLFIFEALFNFTLSYLFFNIFDVCLHLLLVGARLLFVKNDLRFQLHDLFLAFR